MGIEEELKKQHGKGKDSKALKPEKQRSQTKFHNTGIQVRKKISAKQGSE